MSRILSSGAAAAHARRELTRRVKSGGNAVRSFLNVIDIVRQNARHKGYAIAVHGSLLRDIDLVAVPWISRPKAPSTLHKGVFGIVKVMYPKAYTQKRPTMKPQGRLAWSINLGNGTYIDLSVVSPR